MAMEYVKLGGACDGCALAIANNDYTGMSDAQEAFTRAGLERIGECLIVGGELGFSSYGCRVCRNGLAGNKHEVGYLVPLKVSVSRIRLNGGGYDSRGRYWGGGAPLYHVASDYDSINYELRADCRLSAVAEVARRYPGIGFHRGGR